MEYDVNYFIEKFEAIPDKKIIVGMQSDENFNHCALGWCHPDTNKYHFDGSDTNEGKALGNLFGDVWSVASINNGGDLRYTQPTPKKRILAALYDIRDKELSEANIKEASKIVNEVLVNQ